MSAKIVQIKDYDILLTHLAHTCLEQLEGSAVLLPSEKFRLVRALPLIIQMFDSEKSVQRAVKDSKLQLKRILKCLEHYPVVPLYVL